MVTQKFKLNRPLQQNPVQTLSASKKRIFTAIVISIPFLFIVLLELGLRIGGYGENLRLFIPIPNESSPYLGINPSIARRYLYYYGEQFDPIPRKDLFLREKPDNGYRIFVLGASTTAGFPYGNNISFARVLHRRLAEAFPERTIEVINTALTSISTYILLDFTNEILEQQPDALIIYIGHNEFYGSLGPVSTVALGKYPIVVKAILKLQRYKTFLLVRNVIGAGIRVIQRQGALSERSAKNSQQIDESFFEKVQIPFDDRDYNIGIRQYRKNLRAIVKKAIKAHVPVLLSEVVSNVRDQRPFPTLAPDSTSIAFRKYQQACELEGIGKYDDARVMYYQAKDLDPIRFRSPEIFNEIVNSIRQEFDIPIVPMKDRFEEASPHGLIGNNIMLDHVHPTPKGYFLMADAVYETMRRESMISEQYPLANANNTTTFLEDWGYTPLDSVYAQLVLLNLKSGWPFTTEQFSSIKAQQYILDQFAVNSIVDSIALRAYDVLGYSLPMAHRDLGNYYEKRGDIDLALAEYKALIYFIPSMDMSYENALRLLMETEQYERAIQLLSDGLKYHRSAYLYKWLGRLCLIENQFKDGIYYLNQATAYDPDDEQVMFNLIKAYYFVSEFVTADTLLDEFSKNGKNRKDTTKLTKIRKTLFTRARQAVIHINDAQNAFKAKDNESALNALQRSIDILETSTAYEMMGIILFSQDNIDEAIRCLKKAIQLRSDDNPDLWYNLALAYFRAGQQQEASQAFQKLRIIDPNYEDSDILEAGIKQMNECSQ